MLSLSLSLSISLSASLNVQIYFYITSLLSLYPSICTLSVSPSLHSFFSLFSVSLSFPLLFSFVLFLRLIVMISYLLLLLTTCRTLVQRKAVWKPCCFIYIYNVLLLSNPAWNSFLGEECHAMFVSLSVCMEIYICVCHIL